MIPVKYVQITEDLFNQATTQWKIIPGFENYQKACFIRWEKDTILFNFEKEKSSGHIGDYIVTDKEEYLHIFPRSLFELIFEKEIKEIRDQKMQKLIESLGGVVDNYVKMSDGIHYEISTYIFDCSNDGIIVYARFDEFGNIELDDDLYTLSIIPEYTNSKDEEEMVRKFIGPNKNITLKSNNIVAKTTEEKFVTSFFYYVSLLLKIGTMLRTTRKETENEEF